MYEAGMRLVIDDERSMFHGEIATVCATASPYPASTVHVKIEGWPSMSWPTSSVRPATQTDLDRAVIWSYCPHISQLDRMGGLRCPDCGPTLASYAPVSPPRGGSAPQMTGPPPTRRTMC